MSFTHTVGLSYTTEAGSIGTSSSSVTQPLVAAFDHTVPISTTETWPVSVTVTKVKSALITTDKAVDLKTYTGGTGGTLHSADNKTLAAGDFIVWNSNMTVAAPWTVDFDTMTIQNASGSVTATVKIYILQSE